MFFDCQTAVEMHAMPLVYCDSSKANEDLAAQLQSTEAHICDLQGLVAHCLG